VARRFGIPETVLERAERFLSKEALTFDQVIDKLDAERRGLELARAQAERDAEAAQARRRELDREMERLVGRERETITREGEALMASVKRAREELRAAQARLRGTKVTEEDIRRVAKAIDSVAHKTSIGGELEPRAEASAIERESVPQSRIRPGLRVYVPRLRAEAEIVDVLPGGQLRVAAGPLKLTTTVA